MSGSECAAEPVVGIWPTENLVAAGRPTDPIAEPVYWRELPDGYAMSAIGFHSCGAPRPPSDVASYLGPNTRWEWELVPVDQIPETVPWRRPQPEYYQGGDAQEEESIAATDGGNGRQLSTDS